MIGGWAPFRHIICTRSLLVAGVVAGLFALALTQTAVKPALKPSRRITCKTMHIPSGPAGRNLRAAAESLDGVMITSGRSLAVVADVILPMRPSDGYCFAPAKGAMVVGLGAGAEHLLEVVRTCCEGADLETQWRRLPPRSRYLLPFVRDLIIHCPPREVVSFSADVYGTHADISIRRAPLATVRPTPRAPHRCPADPPRMVTACVGDVLVDGIVGAGDVHGCEKICGLLSSADVAVANLEAPMSDRTSPTHLKTPAAIARGQEFIFRSAPRTTMALLQPFGIDAVCLANNHTLDYRLAGLRDTRNILAEAGITSAGAGPVTQARRPVSVGGVTLLSYVEGRALPDAEKFAATAERPGVAVIDLAPSGPSSETAQMVRADIARARRTDGVVVVGVHWGDEGSSEPAPRQVAFAHRCIDAGADMVWGHHPHVLQPVEIYHGGLIAYSLGNFIFPSPRYESLLSSAVLITCHQDRSLAAAALVGVVLDGETSPYGLPELALSAGRQERIRRRLLGK